LFFVFSFKKKKKRKGKKNKTKTKERTLIKNVNEILLGSIRFFVSFNGKKGGKRKREVLKEKDFIILLKFLLKKIN